MRLLRHLLIAAAITSFASPSLAEPVALRLSTFVAPQAFSVKDVLVPWAEKVTSESNGELNVEVFAGGTLGRNPAGQMKQVTSGVSDIAWVLPGYTPGLFDQVTITEIPFLVNSSFEGSVAAWKMVESGAWTGQGFDQVKVLGIFTGTPSHFASTKEIHGASDIPGMNVRGAGPEYLAMIKALGGVPVGGITGPTLAESLSRGLIEGTINDWLSLATFRALDVVKYHIQLPLGTPCIMVVMNKEKYESLSDTAKAAIDSNSGLMFAKFFGDKFDGQDARIAEKAKGDSGRVVTVPTDEETQMWRETLKPVAENWKSRHPDGAELYAKFEAYLKQASAMQR